MAIGPISTPATWNVGTVVAPAWAQGVQDNVNGLLAGIASIAGMTADGVGGATLAPRTADSPLALFKDLAGNARFSHDHIGYPMAGTVLHWREDWRVGVSSYATQGNLIAQGMPLWQLAAANSPTPGLSAGAPVGSLVGYAGPVAQYGIANANARIGLCSTATYTPTAAMSLALVCDMALSAVGANNATAWLGLSGNFDPSTPSGGFAWFTKASGNTNWQCATNDGSATTTSDSGVAPVANTMQQFKIEFHGSSSPYAATTVRFFINGTLVATSLTHLPTAAQFVVHMVKDTSGYGGNATTGYLGTMAMGMNRILSPIAV